MKRVALMLGLLAVVSVTARADNEPAPDGERWPKIRAAVFGDRPIREDDGTRLALTLPARAADAATVPLALEVHRLPGDSPVRKVYLVIDQNPSPLGAIFEFANAPRGVLLETRVRIEDYTWVRAIAETDDGELFAVRRYIKAAGGCSAPAGKSLAERKAGTGQMRWRVEPDGAGRSATAQLLIRHPNNSGLAMDQLTRLYDPPYFVRSVTVTQGGATVFSATVDFTISENPAFRFSLPPGSSGELRAVVVDTDGERFESTAPLSVAPER